VNVLDLDEARPTPPSHAGGFQESIMHCALARTHFPPAVLLISLVAGGASAGGSIPANLLIPGNWSNPANWSSNPNAPNNGQPSPGTTYAATMSNKLVELDVDVTVTDFSMAHVSGSTNVLTNTSGIPTLLTVENVLAYTQGIIAGNTTVMVGPGGTMNFLATPAGQTKQLNASLVNEGLVTINFFTNLQSTGSGSMLVNAPGGTMNVNNGLTLSKLGGSVDPVVINEATATINVVSPGSLTTTWRLDNDGLVNASSSVALNGGGEHEGQFAISPGRSVTFGGAGQIHTLLEDSVLSGGGTATFSSTANVHTSPSNYTVANTQVNPGGFVSYFGPPDEEEAHELGQLTMFGGTLSGEALDVKLLNWIGGLIDVLALFIPQDGFWTVPPFSSPDPRTFDGMIHNSGQASLKGNFTSVGTEETSGVVNSGTMVATSDLAFVGEGTLTNNGLFKTAAGTTSINWKTVFGDDSELEVTPGAALFVFKAKLIKGFLKVDENGRLDLVNDDGQEALAMALIGASMFSNGAANFLGGSLGLREPVTFDVDSKIGGSGRFTIDGKFVFNNKTSPGNSPGTLTIEADELEVGEDHRLEMELGAPGSADVDLLVVDGDLILDGSLEVIAVDGFAPGAYVLITWTGALTDLGLSIGRFPSGYVGAVVVDEASKEVRLEVELAASCPADLDGDKAVTGADLGILISNFGTAGQGDLNGDSTIDGADLGIMLGAWGPCT